MLLSSKKKKKLDFIYLSEY